ncbi:hypothetical protein BHE74_00012340 [Ensete ventricosum]|nr:hypothetical protein GW17_00009724 [Ensete ventricosum]RWW79374.1 hypothetical protein BHE74_00012340 [Ensete ventricosum]
MFRLPRAGRKVTRKRRGRQRLAGDPRAARARGRDTFPLLLLPLPFSSSIDGRFLLQSTADGRFLLQSTVDGRNRPPMIDFSGTARSGQSAYRSAVGPVCTGQYGLYCLVSKTYCTGAFNCVQ